MRTVTSKKGQFYIFAAILLVVYAMTLALPGTSKQAQSSFERLHENYIFEAPKVVNSAIYNRTNPTARLANFSEEYSQYARSIDPSFQFVYAFAYEGNTFIGSKFREEINISTNTTSFILNGDSRFINGTNGFTIHYSKRAYEMNFSKEVLIRALFVSKGSQGEKKIISG